MKNRTGNKRQKKFRRTCDDCWCNYQLHCHRVSKDLSLLLRSCICFFFCYRILFMILFVSNSFIFTAMAVSSCAHHTPTKSFKNRKNRANYKQWPKFGVFATRAFWCTTNTYAYILQILSLNVLRRCSQTFDYEKWLCVYLTEIDELNGIEHLFWFSQIR